MPIKKCIAKKLENGTHVSYCEIGIHFENLFENSFKIVVQQLKKTHTHFQVFLMLRKNPLSWKQSRSVIVLYSESWTEVAEGKMEISK